MIFIGDHEGALTTGRQRRRRSKAASANPRRNNTNPVGPLLNSRITITRYHAGNRYFPIKTHPARTPWLRRAKKIRNARFAAMPSSGGIRVAATAASSERAGRAHRAMAGKPHIDIGGSAGAL